MNEKEVKSLINLILSIERRCKNEKLFLQATVDPARAYDPEAQQGPLVTKMFEMARDMKKTIGRK